MAAWALLVLLPVASRAVAGPDDQVAARVNGVPITQSMVHEVVKSVIAGRPQPPSSEEIQRLSAAALESLIELELLYQEAVARKMRVGEDEIDADIRRTQARFQNEAQFDEALERSGMTRVQLRAETRKTILATRLLEQDAWRDIDVSEEEARRFYDENQDAFRHPEQVSIRYLLVRAPPAAGPERTKAREKAGSIREQAAAGADFAGLARRYSDHGSATEGGDLGFLGRGVLPEPVEAAAFALPTGRISDVIETPGGFHLVQVVARRPAGVKSFEEVRDGIVQTLIEEERQRRKEKFVGDLRQQAKVEMLQ